MRGVLAGGPSASGTGTGRGRGRIYASWTRCRSAPTPKARFCSLGTIRKLTTHKTSFRSAAVIAALRTLHPRCAARATQRPTPFADSWLAVEPRCARFPRKGNHLRACGQARPNIKGGLDDRAIASVAEQSSGASNHLAIQMSPSNDELRGRGGRKRSSLMRAFGVNRDAS